MRILYAYNTTRQSFLSLNVGVADTPLTRLRGFLGRMKPYRDEAIWVVPSQGIHTIGLLFPIDVVYLSADLRVLRLIEHLGTLRIAPIRRHCASVLELPARAIYESGTQVGDQLMICPPEDIYAYWQTQEQSAGLPRAEGL
jgi:uncharacterized membrane protein (UPF0127 family)